MPVVTVDPSQYERYELESAPADPNDPNDEQGYVMLRPMPYGMALTMRDNAVKQRMLVEQPKRGAKRDDRPTEVVLESASEWATNFEWSYCIGDHNLQTVDRNGKKSKLDFSNPMAVKLLDPKVGREIEKYLFDLNNIEDDESIEDFLRRSTSSSETEPSLSQTDSPDKPKMEPSVG